MPIKTALALRGMMAEEFRLPMCPMDAAGRAKLETLLEDYADLIGTAATTGATETKSARPKTPAVA